MNIYTIGFTKKSAEEFFNIIMNNNIEIIIDVRVNNSSQLSAFTKAKDLSYFLKKIANIKYKHIPEFAPTKEILNDYKKKILNWKEYEIKFNELMLKRNIVVIFNKKINDAYDKICLLCSEPTSENCHRRLVAEFIQKNYKKNAIKIKHI